MSTAGPAAWQPCPSHHLRCRWSMELLRVQTEFFRGVSMLGWKQEQEQSFLYPGSFVCFVRENTGPWSLSGDALTSPSSAQRTGEHEFGNREDQDFWVARRVCRCVR